MYMAMLGSFIARLLYPENAVCIACGALHTDTPTGLCQACQDKLIPYDTPRCPLCGKPGWAMACPRCAIKGQGTFQGRIVAFPYEETARLLVLALKYSSVFKAAEVLAPYMADALPRGSYDALVPVPLHPQKEIKRGFNQARVLCEALSPLLGLPVMDAIRRTRNTRTQTQLSKAGRQRNMEGAFAPLGDLGGRHLILVDDVLTTGATATACAQVMERKGAGQITLLAVARASPGMDG